MLIMMARVMKYATTNGLQGNNKAKTPTTSENHFRRTISVLYILYCANFVNWTNGSVIAVKAISKLAPFNNDTQFMNGHFREHYHDLLYSFDGDVSKQRVLFDGGNGASILLTPTQRTQTKVSAEMFAHSKHVNRRRHNFNAPSNAVKTMEIKTVTLPVPLQYKLCGLTRNKLKNLIKWKIRKKIVKCATTQTHRVKRNANDRATSTNNSTLMTTNYDTASIMTTQKPIRSQYKSTTAFNSRNAPDIISTTSTTTTTTTTTAATITTTQFTPNAITTINSITQIESSNRSIKPQQQSLHRSRETNVFEMATKLKYNKLAKSTAIPDASRKGKISLLGLFELSTRVGLRTEGQSELAAAQMAVRHINSKNILNGYTIELLTNDTKCDPGVGVDRFFHALYTQLTTRMVMLLGSACSEVTESLAKVVPYWNIVQVSFGSTSPALSDRREFPLFYRTVAPDSSHNPARIAFIRRFGWDTVTTFSQNEEIHSLAVNDLVTELESANISCAATITFAETDFKDQLKMLRDLDTRIIIGSFSPHLAPKIFCEAFKLGMYGADYAWILHETIGPPWWKQSTADCSQSDMADAAQNVLVVSSHNSIVGAGTSYSGLSNKMFRNELAAFHSPHPMSRYAPQTYDAVWAIALAMRGAEQHWRNSSLSLKLDGFDYTRYDMTSEFMNQFRNMKFLGVSGPVSFSGADRIGTSIFYQIQHGRLQPVALYHPSESLLDFNCPECVQIKWKGGQVPIAKRIFKLRVATIAPFAFYTITSFASVGITLSIAFLAFNLHFRKLKSIKLSSPKLSNITAVGCILVYAAVVLLGLDYSTLPANDKAFSAVCTARVYLLSSGFSLAFGSMFAKTYRVHRIFTHSGGGVCKDKMLRDTQLISLVCALLLLDGLVVTLWVIADPMERHLSNLTLEISSIDRSVVYQPQVEVCRSHHTQSWLGALYAYKGLLLIVGVYMAWETRNVKIPALNDSQYIGVSVYSVVITSAIIVVLANFLAEKVTLAFVTITALILASTTATLSLLFLPKINDIWGKGVINDPVIHSMGLKMECNTRRFVTDDRRELQYRVEVQNRVYKKEMAALDAEIVKLQKMLESNSSTSSSDLSMLQSIKHEIAIVNECISGQKKCSDTRTPSIGGGLPLLLLSVLPPVIPRASWPSSDHCVVNPMRQSVTFSSQPQLDNEGRQSAGIARLPAIDLFNLRLTHQQATEARTGILDRIKGIFVSNRKDSTISYTEASQALRRHMTRLTGIVSYQATSSCNTLDTGNKILNNQIVAKSGTAINISYPSNEDVASTIPPFIISNSLAESIDGITVDTEPESRVFFQLPKDRRSSILHQNSQPTLRERVKGSPRFPHRIAPTSSLSALQERAYKVSTLELSDTSGSKCKWKSMEESTFSTTLPNSSASMVPDGSNQIKPPVQFESSIKSEIQISSNEDDDDDDYDDDNGVRGDDGECKEFVENVDRNYDKTHPEEIVSDL